MELLNLLVRITARDEASETIDDVSGNAIGKLVGAAKSAAKALAGMWAVKKAVDFGKAAFDAYAQFEQLEGGVAKLYGNANMELDEYLASMKDSGKSVDELTKTYERNEQAQKLMMQQASDAWKTAGMDANTYMEQATSMSAALINSLGGDTVEAAKQTDVAMKAMSDNVNTFGTDMASVSQAFMGFSKQNYTMLDNLKLGYGGTKTEMERLIADANEWGRANGKASDLSIESFSDVVTAIEQIQQKQGIAGTTTREAMTTIEGSMNATKAAWQNLVTEFGKPDADIGARIKDMFTAVMGENGEGGLLRNVTKEVGTIARNMVSAVADGVSAGFDWLVANGPDMARKVLNGIAISIGKAGSFFGNLDLSGLIGDGEELAGRVTELVTGIANSISAAWPNVVSAIQPLAAGIEQFVATNGPLILGKVGEVLGNIGNAILEHGPEILTSVAEAYASVVEWVSSHGPDIVDKVAEIAGNVITTAAEWISSNGPRILEAAGRAFMGIAQAIMNHAPEVYANIGKTIGKVIGYVINAAGSMLSAGKEFFGGLIDGTSEEGEALRQWFADFFPDGLLEVLGGIAAFGTMLLDAGKALIDGLLDGIGEVAPDVENAIRGAFQTVIDWFGKVGDFLADPVGSIKDGLQGLVGSFDDTSSDIDRDTDKARSSIGKLNSTQLRDKKATATVSGNAIDGKAKKSVNDTDRAVQGLKSKSVDVTVNQRGMTKDNIDRLRDSIDRMRDKSVTVTTSNVTKNTVITEHPKAWGGIRRHARGDIMVANNPGPGVPLDIVGEAGPEAIVPLTSRYGRDFAEMMGEAAAKVMGAGGPTVNVYMTYNAGEDAAQLVSDVADGLRLVLGGN